MTGECAKWLAKFDMCPGNGVPGLFFVDTSPDDPYVRVALEEAARYGADAVFFRHCAEAASRAPEPVAYIYYRESLLDQFEFGAIQRRLSSAGAVPLAYAFSPIRAWIANMRRQPDAEPQGDDWRFCATIIEQFELGARIDDLFKARSLAAGLTWEAPSLRGQLAFENSPHWRLLTHLNHVRKELCALPGLRGDERAQRLLKRLLVAAILIKYLEERHGTDGSRVFPPDYFSDFSQRGASCFCDLLSEPGGTILALRDLRRCFNGGIFEFGSDEEQQLVALPLDAVAEFLRGTTEPSGQGLFWPAYSFDDLPVELISNIYQEFLEDEDGVVYTPPLLAWVLIDQVLPLCSASLGLRILDPACGSGVFLVSAFKRLVQCWRMANGWRKPSHQDLKGILADSIYGIDRKEEAVLVTAFSLAVALCDELEPKVIWEELRFDDLRDRNLFARDFFEVAADHPHVSGFDVVVGNPPFKETFATPAARKASANRPPEAPPIPGNQLALLFLEEGIRVCREGGRICLLQDSSPLLYNLTGQEYRRFLFGWRDFDAVLDLTPLDETFFGTARVNACAMLGTNKPASGNPVLHAIFRRTLASNEKLSLDIDAYDLHWVSAERARSCRYVWKTNLLGGGRLHRVADRLEAQATRTVKGFLEERPDWLMAEGFNRGLRKLYEHPTYDAQKDVWAALDAEELRTLLDLPATPCQADYLTGRSMVPPAAISAEGIDWSLSQTCEDAFFVYCGDRCLYARPHVLIAERLDGLRIPAVYCDRAVVFSKQVVGVHAPAQDAGELREFARRLRETPAYALFLALFSPRWLVKRNNSVLKGDIMALPYPEDAATLDLAWWEDILAHDVFEHAIPFRNRPLQSPAISRTSDDDLVQFGDVYCRLLNAVYERFRPVASVRSGGFACCTFCHGDAPDVALPAAEELLPFVERLARGNTSGPMVPTRIMRCYSGNVVLMVKPDQKRFWLRSIAMRDADETLADLLEQGY